MTLPAETDAERKRASKTPWIVGGLIALAFLLLVAAVAGVGWYGYSLFDSQARAAIQADPAIGDAVGRIRQISLDLTATGNAPGGEDFAYRIEGERASGLLVGRFVTIDADTEELREGRLMLDDGRVVKVGTSVAAATAAGKDTSTRDSD